MKKKTFPQKGFGTSGNDFPKRFNMMVPKVLDSYPQFT